MRQGNRAMKAGLRRLLARYAREQDCEPQSALRDLLIDLRHLGDEVRLDVHEALDGSYEAYLEERAEERERR